MEKQVHITPKRVPIMASQLRAIRRKTQQVATIAAGIIALATTTAVVIDQCRQRT